jgi:hypothetical protein
LWKAIPHAYDPVISRNSDSTVAQPPRLRSTGPKKICPAVALSWARATACAGPVPTMADEETIT